MNTDFAKVVDGKIVFAGNTVSTTEGIVYNPSADDYKSAGYHEVINDPPTVQYGMEWKVQSFTENANGTISIQYEVIQSPLENFDPVESSDDQVREAVNELIYKSKGE